MKKQWITNKTLRAWIDETLKDNPRKRGITTGHVVYLTNEEFRDKKVCVSVHITKEHWCERHRDHLPKKRKGQPIPSGDAK